MDQESQDLAGAYSAGFQSGVEACAKYLEKLAEGEKSYFNFSNVYRRMAEFIRVNVISD